MDDNEQLEKNLTGGEGCLNPVGAERKALVTNENHLGTHDM